MGSSMMVNLWQFVGIEWDITIYNQQKSIMASWEILERHWQFSMGNHQYLGDFRASHGADYQRVSQMKWHWNTNGHQGISREVKGYIYIYTNVNVNVNVKYGVQSSCGKERSREVHQKASNVLCKYEFCLGGSSKWLNFRCNCRWSQGR